MRVTHHAVAQTALLGLNSNLFAVNKLQQQLTSGKQISAPSDSPTGTNTAMQVRQEQSATLQHARNISDGQGRLDATDTALTTILSQVRKVRDLTVQGMNTGATSSSSAKAIGVEVKALRDSLLGVANQTLNGKPLFGGVTTGGAAYDTTTGAYIGVGGADGVEVVPTMRRVSNTQEVRIDITGPEAFGDPVGQDLFAVVANIADHVTADPDSLSSDLADL